MNGSILLGLMIPFAGTSLGSACVFLMKQKMNRQIERAVAVLGYKVISIKTI